MRSPRLVPVALPSPAEERRRSADLREQINLRVLALGPALLHELGALGERRSGLTGSD